MQIVCVIIASVNRAARVITYALIAACCVLGVLSEFKLMAIALGVLFTLVIAATRRV